jgi:protein gp37
MGNPRYRADGNPRTSGPGFGLTLHWDKLGEPPSWSPTRPRWVFVNSMSDLFHARVSIDFLARAFAAMAQAPVHTFMILTKRPGRLPRVIDRLETLVRDLVPGEVAWPLPNVWLGTSVEDQKRADERIPKLLDARAQVRFLSCEPLLGPVDLHLFQRAGSHELPRQELLHWVIVGGESGPERRRFDADWARSLRDQCLNARVAYFFKQHGGRTPKAGGRLLDGRTWDEFPSNLRGEDQHVLDGSDSGRGRLALGV